MNEKYIKINRPHSRKDFYVVFNGIEGKYLIYLTPEDVVGLIRTLMKLLRQKVCWN